MKTYTLTKTADNFDSIREEMLAELSPKLTGSEIELKGFGIGKITQLSSSNRDDVITAVQFSDGTVKRFMLKVILYELKTATFIKEELTEVVDEFFTELSQLFAEACAAKVRLEAEAKAEAKRQEEIKKAEAKAESLKANAVKEFEKLTAKAKAVSTVDEFYYGLGWLAKNVKTVAARMPDYLEAAFVKHFGSEAVHTVTDSTKRTVNGFPMQWAISFTASLPKKAEVPSMLTKYLNTSGTAIANTSFVWDLVDNYGFRFGKVQDTVEILRHVPIQYVYIFNEGYNA
jgi:hypothetical protein